jgi:CRP-like cAMP-binding protein
VTTFEKDQVIYDVGDENQTFFFVQKGFVKVGSVTEDGHELIYDVRKAGDIVGELCASGQLRRDRAVALERTEVIAVPLGEVLDIVQKNRHLLQELVQICCESLSDAYDQLNTLAFSDTVHRLVRVLLRLGTQLGHTSGQRTELSAYLTQEEISQMVAARRERVSTAMNFLRNRGNLAGLPRLLPPIPWEAWLDTSYRSKERPSLSRRNQHFGANAIRVSKTTKTKTSSPLTRPTSLEMLKKSLRLAGEI